MDGTFTFWMMSVPSPLIEEHPLLERWRGEISSRGRRHPQIMTFGLSVGRRLRLWSPFHARWAHNSALASLQIIKRLNPSINAVVHTSTDEEVACEVADSPVGSDGYLSGVPILVKDSIEVKGMPTCVGMKERMGSIAVQDAPVISRLRSAGAVILGKTNVPEGCTDLQTFNEAFGKTSNPYDTSLTAGGSSGGSAAAVASGMVPLAVGSDLLGSLRVPSSFCGVPSLRPTCPRLPHEGHLPSAFGPVNTLTIGAIASDVNMLKAFMQAASTPVDGGGETLALPPMPMRPVASLQPGDIRAIVTPSLKGVPTDTGITAAIESFADLISGRGVAVELREEGIVSEPKALMAAHKLFFSLLGDVSLSSSSTVTPGQQGGTVTPAQIADADHARLRARREICGALAPGRGGRKESVWIMPVCGVNAFPHNPTRGDLTIDDQPVNYWKALTGYAFQASTAGCPIVTLPIAMCGDVPVGVQVIGRAWCDEELLEVCAVLEAMCVGRLYPPGLHGGSQPASS